MDLIVVILYHIARQPSFWCLDFVLHRQTAIQLATERRHREVVRGAWVVVGILGLHCGVGRWLGWLLI